MDSTPTTTQYNNVKLSGSCREIAANATRDSTLQFVLQQRTCWELKESPHPEIVWQRRLGHVSDGLYDWDRYQLLFPPGWAATDKNSSNNSNNSINNDDDDDDDDDDEQEDIGLCISKINKMLPPCGCVVSTRFATSNRLYGTSDDFHPESDPIGRLIVVFSRSDISSRRLRSTPAFVVFKVVCQLPADDWVMFGCVPVADMMNGDENTQVRWWLPRHRLF